MEPVVVAWCGPGAHASVWPFDVADAGWDAVRVIGIGGQTDRPAARRAIRAALHAALVQWSGLPLDRIALHADADTGQAPYALLSHHDGRVQRVGLAITHDGALSLAAFGPNGAVGVDVMQVVDTPDRQAVGRDYLGPVAVAALEAVPAPLRAAAFARLWSEHEARLKCLGLGLAEWDAALARRLAGCRTRPLVVPDGYAGHVALPGSPIG
jgi:4'-phosphopantetheinyl transferase